MAIQNRYVNASAVGGGNGLSDATAWTLVEGFANSNAGYITWIKKGAYTVSSTLAPTNAGTVGSPNIFRGYNITPGDLTGARLSNGELDVSNYPTITIATGIHLNVNTSYTHLEFLNIIGSMAATSPVVFSTGTAQYSDSTRYESTTNGAAYGLTLTSNINIHNCDIICSSTGQNSTCISVGSSKLDNCFFKMMGATITFGYVTGCISGFSCAGCTFYPNANAKVFTFSSSNSVNITANTIVGCSDVFNTANSAQTGQAFITENVICNCNRVINNQYAATGPHNLLLRDNRIRNIVNTDILGASDMVNYNSITTDLGGGDSQDFVDYTNHNFRMVYNAPGRFKTSNGNDLGALAAVVNPVSVSNVRSGVDNGVGQLGNIIIPSTSNLLSGIGAGSNGTEITGNVIQPSISDVRQNTTYGPANSLTGTLIVSTGGTMPVPKDVRYSTIYGPSNSYVGLLTPDNYYSAPPVFDTYPETIYLESEICTVISL